MEQELSDHVLSINLNLTVVFTVVVVAKETTVGVLVDRVLADMTVAVLEEVITALGLTTVNVVVGEVIVVVGLISVLNYYYKDYKHHIILSLSSPCVHFLSAHAFLRFPRPPNFVLSLQLLHSPQSSSVQPTH